MFFFAVHGTTDAALHEGIEEILKLVEGGDLLVCTSVLVHIEASVERLTRFPKKHAFLRGLYETVEMIQADSRVIKLAAEIRDFYALGGNTLSTPDAIHLASAIHYEANEFHTSDGTGAESGRGKLLKLPNPIAEKYRLDIRVPKAQQPTLLAKTGRGIAQTPNSSSN